jgi:hypothetical protein
MHKDQFKKEQKLLKYLSKEKKTEFDKLLEELEKKKVPTRQCSIDDVCESCSG